MKITSRQREAIQAINKYIEKNKKSPTYKEMRDIFGVRSDQAVAQLISKLENIGLIKRNKKSRGIVVTEKAYEELPELTYYSPRLENKGGIGTLRNQEFTLTQKKLIEKLGKINSKLVNIYKGAVLAISERTNPDWVAQSAHSLREISYILSNEAGIYLTKEEKQNTVKKNETFSKIMLRQKDPNSNFVCLKEMLGEIVYDEWNKYHQQIVSISHHTEIEEGEYLRKVEDYEKFLLDYVFVNQIDIYKLIDKEIDRGAENASVKELRRLTTQNLSALQYFFSKTDHKWLEFLYNNNFLVPIRSAGEFLVKSAEEKPGEVMNVIANYEEKYVISEDNRFFRTYFIEAALVMPSSIAKNIVGKIIKDDLILRGGKESGYWAIDMRKIIQKLIADKEHKSVIKLLKYLLEVKIEKDKSISLKDISSYIDKYTYHEIVKSIDVVPEAKMIDYVIVLVDKLRNASELFVDKQEEHGGSDSSYIWYQFIEEGKRLNTNDVCDVLILYVKKYIVKYFDYLTKTVESKEPLQKEFNRIFQAKDNYFVFKMIQIAIFRKYPNAFLEKIQWVIVEEFDKYELSQEYDQLVFEVFDIVEESFKKKYFELVEQGPKQERDVEYIRQWKIEKYALVKKSLTPELLAEYKKLLGGNKEPIVPRRKFGASAGWVGPTTPKKEKELKEMSVEDIIDFFIEWKPSGKHFDHSRHGLAREFSKVVQENPGYFSDRAKSFDNFELRPVYLYEYYFGLREALKKDAIINWGEIVCLSKIIVDKAKKDKLLKDDFIEDGFLLDWNTVFQYMASLLEVALNKNLVDITLREDIWEVIAYICENSEPSLEYEKEQNEDIDYMHLSINTTRGVAFHSLFAYIFWVDRQLKLKDSGSSRIVEEAKEVLERHLDPKNEPGNVIQSVYGRYFHWLYIFDKEWGGGHVEEIFPEKITKRRYAAWESYLIGGVFREVFELLRDKYKLAIEELRKGVQRSKFSHDSKELLIHHLMIAYFYRLISSDDPLLKLFYKTAKAKHRGEAVSFAGRSYIASDVKDKNPPDYKRLKQFWEWRLKMSNSVNELKEFGWWVREDFFDNEWMLRRLLETLEKTNGIIEADFRMIDALSLLARDYPVLTAKCLLLYLKIDDIHQRSMRLAGSDKIKKTIVVLRSQKDEDVQNVVDEIIDYLLKLGYNDYINIR